MASLLLFHFNIFCFLAHGLSLVVILIIYLRFDIDYLIFVLIT